MPDSRYPKICLKRLFVLADVPSATSRYNWASQVRDMLLRAGAPDLWGSLSPEAWESRADAILRALERQLRLEDQVAWENLNCKLPSVSLPCSPDSYLLVRCPLAMTRLKAQVRLSTVHNCRFAFNGHLYNLLPKEICSVCNLNVLETVDHFVRVCPLYAGLRAHYLSDWLGVGRALSPLLDDHGTNSTKALFCYMTNALCLRAFLRNE